MARPKTKMDLDTRTLEDLGLSQNEAVLYSLMLSRPASTVRELGVRSALPRTLLYHVLSQLTQRGLVSSQKSTWRTTYIAEDPTVLYDLLAKREEESKREAQALRELIPNLKQRYSLAGKRPTVRVFEGVAEYEKALDDSLAGSTKEVFCYEHFVRTKPGHETRASHERRRVLRKISKRILFFESKESLKELVTRTYNDFTQYRSITGGAVVPFDADVTLYDGKVLYTSYPDVHEPIAVLIEDQALYTMQKNIFDSLWAQAKDRTLYYTEAR